jgi:hypothetical protein
MVRSVVNIDRKFKTMADEAGKNRGVCVYCVRSDSGSSCKMTMPDRSRSASE